MTDNSTRILLQEYHDHLLVKEDVQAELQETATIRLLTRFHKFELLDSVFQEFIASNDYMGTHHTFSDLLQNSDRHKCFYCFWHLGIPYLATVYVTNGPRVKWLNVKLCNDGFEYSQKQGVELYRHQCEGWIALTADKFSPYLPAIVSTTKPLYGSFQGFYNYKHRRFDLKFYPRSEAPASTPHLLITFEPGFPYEDEAMPIHPIP